ncbi:SGNH/GDSL hydrolase family protein [Alicyclobacillus sp.]|uniref:SGNH/GDSL hydrolase family protein n=1 Tax=Alicyclobacillus sp. TaxID=61169 RepID=UPI0025C11B6A|nr:SGNH/GDSL hydrolase family protein [Alicyclobacillus sp.]MCL6515846.1 SGNH/GDSL hydrolase family protein [Alicyclobacillus sp.]
MASGRDRRWVGALCALALLVTLLTIPAAPAAADTRRPSGALLPGQRLVALGDSIPFGYGLPGAVAPVTARSLSELRPAPAAYPLLVARDNQARAVDLAVPGWTSSDLLGALGTAPFAHALRQANVVTIEIGSNDLLRAAPERTAAQTGGAVRVDPARVQAAISQLGKNLPLILAAVRKQTAAPIVLFNLYNPYPAASSLHTAAESAVSAANQVIAATAAQNAIPVVDAHAVMDGHQTLLIRVAEGDIHPNAAGQRALADALEEVLRRPLWHTPAYFATAKSGTLVYSRPAPGPYAIRWLDAKGSVLVTGMEDEWLKVVTPDGQTGYVRRNQVSVALRWPDNTVAP